MPEPLIRRTSTSDPDFIRLIAELDHELWDELKEDQATYDPHNNVSGISTALVLYIGDEPVASGCLRGYSADTTEIKRMYVRKAHRGRGLSRVVLSELENWAREEGFRYAILETSIRFDVAIRLYQSSGYSVIPNYGPYRDLEESVCMKKELQGAASRR